MDELSKPSSERRDESLHRRAWVLVEKMWALIEKVITDPTWGPFLKLLILIIVGALIVWLLRGAALPG